MPNLISDHENVLAVQALENGAALISDANDLDVWVFSQVTANNASNTGVHGSAQT